MCYSLHEYRTCVIVWLQHSHNITEFSNEILNIESAMEYLPNA